MSTQHRLILPAGSGIVPELPVQITWANGENVTWANAEPATWSNS